MEMYKELMAYYDSQELSKLQRDWNSLESKKHKKGVCVEDLINSWGKFDIFFELEELEESKKIIITNQQAPMSTELFL